MRLVEISQEEFVTKAYRRTKLFALLMEFKNSDMTAARIDGSEYKTAQSGANSIRKAAQRFNIGGITVIERNGNIYLLKED